MKRMMARPASRYKRLMQREDFVANPAKAVLKRIYYRVRRRVSDRPWTLLLDGDLRVTSPIISTPGTAIYYLGASEPQTLRLYKQLLRPGMTVVDIGAHIGEYALIAAREVGPGGHVYAFEPGSGVFPYLEQNAAQNGMKNVECFQSAVGDRTGTLQFNLGVDPGHSRLIVDGQGAEGLDSLGVVTVPVTTLDDFLSSRGTSADFLKIDVEGAEMSVLRGARRTLGQAGANAPIILFEYLSRTWSEYGDDLETGLGYLHEMGYRAFEHAEDGSLHPVDISEIDQVNSDELDLMLLAMKPEHFTRMGSDAPRVVE